MSYIRRTGMVGQSGFGVYASGGKLTAFEIKFYLM